LVSHFFSSLGEFSWEPGVGVKVYTSNSFAPTEKSARQKSRVKPQIGNRVQATRNKPNLVELIDLDIDIQFAMIEMEVDGTHRAS
jgi:hypothetical protein